MAIDFPNSPVTNDTYVVGDRKWVYDGEKWALVPASPELLVVSPTAPTNTNVIWADTAVAGTINSFIPSGAMMPFAGATSPTGWLLCYGQTLVRASYPDLFAVVGTTYNTGGEASTDFRLPDLRGRTVAGLDNMGGTDAGRLDIANSSGTVVGSQYVTLTSAQSGLRAHSHANTASFTGTPASHNHVQDAHGHSGSATENASTSFLRLVGVIGTSMEANHFVGRGTGSFADYAGAFPQHSHVLSINGNTATNQATSITPAGSVTMSNVDNTASDATAAHSVMQPTIVLTYIIKT